MPDALYFDAYSGLSGDMTLGALLHLGMPLEHLRAELARLDVGGYRLEGRTVLQHGIAGIKLEVVLENPTNEVHRPVSLIHGLIDDSTLPARVKERAKAVFWALAVAEGRVHNIGPEEIHFHEVGAVDAIVDIVGACIGFEYFDITEFYCSPLPLGSGFVRAAHGLMPVPAPATLELLAGAGATVAPALTLPDGTEYPARAEMVTPTGAALVATLARFKGTRPAITLKGAGYGYGSREFAWPNALRLWLGSITRPGTQPSAQSSHKQAEHGHAHENHPDHEHNHEQHHEQVQTHPQLHSHPQDSTRYTPNLASSGSPLWERGEVSLIETNLDDMTPEGLGYLQERLMAAEALDVFFTPIQMKKNRPAVKLSVLARPADEERLVALVLAESSTFGVRCSRLTRYMAGREFRQVETSLGAAQVKLKLLGGRIVEAVPEYESVATLARQSGRPWREIYEEVRQAAQTFVETK